VLLVTFIKNFIMDKERTKTIEKTHGGIMARICGGEESEGASK
jgi:hypothetical protein